MVIYSPLAALSLLAICAVPVIAQGPGGPAGSAAPGVPGGCTPALFQQIEDCRAQVEADEAALPAGSCTAADWWPCTCNIQQGLLACYNVCPETAPAYEVEYNARTCDGRYGAVNAAAVSGGPEYQGSLITTTAAGVLSSTSMSTSAISTTASTSVDPITTSTMSTSTSSSTRTSSTPPSTSSTTPASSTVEEIAQEPETTSAPATSQAAASPGPQPVSANIFENAAGTSVEHVSRLVLALLFVCAFMLAA